MSVPPRTRDGLALLAAGLGVGVAADVLAHTVPERLDAALGLGVLAQAFGALALAGVVPRPERVAPLGLPLGLLGLALIWRDSPILFALNLLGIGLVAVLATPWVRAAGWVGAGLTDYALGAGRLAGGAAGGAAVLVLTDIDWGALPAESRTRTVRGTAIGLVAAVPVAAVFGGLLMQADPVFDRLMTRTFAVDLYRLVSHLSMVLLWGWIAAGLLRALSNRDAGAERGALRGGRLGLGEVGTVLAVVDLLFLAFVAVQFRYLFGGAALVQGLTGMSYAEYARRGFFELVTIAALSLPLLLLADWSLDQGDRRRVRRFRLLAGLMLLLLDVMLASALFRMRLYTAEYGLTEQRFYTTAFMGWLVLVFGWFAATVLRGRRGRFTPGALAGGLLVLLALNLVNPDGLMARTNLARAWEGRRFDAKYAARLSADALPTILPLLPALPPADRCAVSAALRTRWSSELSRSNRWNISISRASRLLAAQPAVLGPNGDRCS
ncbi:MAG TPA: DUF4173 domain-containing protein [Gemmatimonadales bacterium]|nr:DUF4173 domain-containing protein [Gemmatimonadales bacterium]